MSTIQTIEEKLATKADNEFGQAVIDTRHHMKGVLTGAFEMEGHPPPTELKKLALYIVDPGSLTTEEKVTIKDAAVARRTNNLRDKVLEAVESFHELLEEGTG